jgi:hypothetical protein
MVNILKDVENPRFVDSFLKVFQSLSTSFCIKNHRILSPSPHCQRKVPLPFPRAAGRKPSEKIWQGRWV